MEQKLLDINTVCRMLGTTSRTLRFYEEKGIVQSTVNPFSTRRQYSMEQLEQIKKVLVLRSLGLPVAEIRKLQQEKGDLGQAILERRAKVMASITTKTREIALLNEALQILERGGDVFAPRKSAEMQRKERLKTVEVFSDAFLAGELEICYSFFDDVLQKALPFEDFAAGAKETLRPVGNYVSRGVRWTGYLPDTVYIELEYENVGVYLQLVFKEHLIRGIWMSYYEPKEK
ncbi:MAG: MerR family transcriptional regulator [Clostridia bacterium]|nr:MerR family transcriptional regulator [Clostridia bacterium]